MQRRPLLAAGAALALITPARAAWGPSRPIELVAHNGPGSGPDVFARALISTIEQERLFGGRIQVANRVGGGGATAMNYVVEKRGDPHVISVWTSLWTSLPLVQAEARATLADMTPICRMAIEPALIVVRADSPHRSFADLVAAAKARPGSVRQSGGSPTARDGMMRQVLMQHTGARWAFISFPSGGERMAALLGGHVDMMIIEPSEAGEQVRAGRLRVLAQLNPTRLPGFPGVPTLSEAGFPVNDVVQARGIVAPPGMPAEAVEFYTELFGRLSDSAGWKKYLDDNQFHGAWLGPQETATFFGEYQAQLRGILQEAGVRLTR
ncbi:Bug family tripartite tricarboxylate transporter substrate binding protein [Falsiroseomonas sp. HW251]|uniref:Bug family tripartite tricarboxylate transporter substrate binding protein n=1 Tax=Falsiroseomonas sp. HW251 TaxID=3390998 RepID=UPI003D312160